MFYKIIYFFLVFRFYLVLIYNHEDSGQHAVGQKRKKTRFPAKFSRD